MERVEWNGMEWNRVTSGLNDESSGIEWSGWSRMNRMESNRVNGIEWNGVNGSNGMDE